MYNYDVILATRINSTFSSSSKYYLDHVKYQIGRKDKYETGDEDATMYDGVFIFISHISLIYF